ncbi:hypothetical protein C8Q75DRAFT_734954 [Abortiporus biennis]|nr:hypothetical protein C8Q75DRAFT_734954 [Abortiporus biennis]
MISNIIGLGGRLGIISMKRWVNLGMEEGVKGLGLPAHSPAFMEDRLMVHAFPSGVTKVFNTEESSNFMKSSWTGKFGDSDGPSVNGYLVDTMTVLRLVSRVHAYTSTFCAFGWYIEFMMRSFSLILNKNVELDILTFIKIVPSTSYKAAGSVP